jgi:hypothetical protein
VELFHLLLHAGLSRRFRKIRQIGEAVAPGRATVINTPRQVTGAEAVAALTPVTAMLDHIQGLATNTVAQIDAARTLAAHTLEGAEPRPMVGALDLIIPALGHANQRRATAQQAIHEFITRTSAAGRAGN